MTFAGVGGGAKGGGGLSTADHFGVFGSHHEQHYHTGFGDDSQFSGKRRRQRSTGAGAEDEIVALAANGAGGTGGAGGAGGAAGGALLQRGAAVRRSSTGERRRSQSGGGRRQAMLGGSARQGASVDRYRGVHYFPDDSANKRAKHALDYGPDR